jgi:hypothetical protein
MILGVGACGGDSADPLVSGSLTGVYKGQTFTPVNGYATVYTQTLQNQSVTHTLIALGDGSIHCGTESAPAPPSGSNVVFFLPATITTQAYTGVTTQIMSGSGNSWNSIISSNGNVTITAITDTTIAGSVSYDYTDSMTQDHYSVSGTFEVTKCN